MVEAAPDVQEEPKQNGHKKLDSEVENAVDPPKINGSETTAANNDATHEKRPHTDVDADAQQMVIASLRSQVQDLFSQVNELNNKLVKSYDRVSDLEDDLHVASEANRSSSLKISQLESEREQHLSALDTGLLVEKSQVTAELTRLMEKATEEAAHRGQAESARQAIEKDLDDLSATLFGQANTMVAEARFARHESEQKVENAERNLKSAEEAVSAMQQQIQVLRTEKEEAERKVEASQTVLGVTTGKGKGSSQNPIPSLRLLSSHSPYQEFMLFVAHLRSVHSSSSQLPAISSLLPLPFLARLLTEDSEPTIRFDLAPSLNWLSRRSVLAAIHNGQLIIEPMSLTTFVQEVTTSGATNTGNISCALCGTSIFSTSTAGVLTTFPLPPDITQSNSGSTSWSAALFKKPSAPNYSISTNGSISSTPTPSQSLQQISPPQVYIFKLATPSSTMSSIPLPSLPRASNTASSSSSPILTHTDNHASYISSPNPQQSSTIYPLCTNWCLSRLRSTCSLWAFVRSGIVEKIWEEEVPTLTIKTIPPTGEKPPIPPRRRGLWSMASAFGERAVSWGEGDKDKAKRAKAAEKPPSSTSPLELKSDRRRLPPPLPSKAASATTTTRVHAIPAIPVAPPPLPKRSEVRQSSPPAVSAPTALPGGPSDKSAGIIITPAIAEEISAAPLASTETPATASASDDPAQTSVTDIARPGTTAAAAHQEPKLPPRPPRRPMNPESRPQTPPSVNAGLGNPVPPPLPRRAATRASRVPDSSTPSRTPTPAGPIAESNAEEADQTPGSEQAGLSSPDAAATTEGGTKEKKPEAGEVNRSVISLSAEEEVFVDAESESVSESEKEEGKPGKEMEGGVQVGLPEGGVDNQVEEKAEKDGEEAEKDEAKIELRAGEEKKVETKTREMEENTETKTEEEIEKKTETIEGKVDADENLKKVVSSPDIEIETTGKKDAEKDIGHSAKLPDNDSFGNYVGDATWEERTWKEIIRLKEAMFWARIGGSKQ